MAVCSESECLCLSPDEGSCKLSEMLAGDEEEQRATQSSAGWTES